ncbi:MAG: hypothetical protein RL748_794 [Pseudomonadota bacterium]
MDLPDTICANARILPVELQQEALDFIAFISRRSKINPVPDNRLNTSTFIQKFAGCLGADFPDDISTLSLPDDAMRENF